jgi:hypothetical protein
MLTLTPSVILTLVVGYLGLMVLFMVGAMILLFIVLDMASRVWSALRRFKAQRVK